MSKAQWMESATIEEKAMRNEGTLDMSRLEVIEDFETGEIGWTGTVDEFDIAQLDDDEQDHLMENGFVVIGGGAQAVMCVRFALATGGNS